MKNAKIIYNSKCHTEEEYIKFMPKLASKEPMQFKLDVSESLLSLIKTTSIAISSISIVIIAIRLGPVSRQAHYWNTCIKQEMKHVEIITSSKGERVWFAVPNCYGNKE